MTPAPWTSRPVTSRRGLQIRWAALRLERMSGERRAHSSRMRRVRPGGLRQKRRVRLQAGPASCGEAGRQTVALRVRVRRRRQQPTCRGGCSARAMTGPVPAGRSKETPVVPSASFRPISISAMMVSSLRYTPSISAPRRPGTGDRDLVAVAGHCGDVAAGRRSSRCRR